MAVPRVRSRAMLLGLLAMGMAAAPLAAGLGGAGPALLCEERMLAELGWLDSPLAGSAHPDIALDPSLEVPAPQPEPDLHDDCVGKIQPGARFSNIGCTMNFIFRDQLGRLYLGTAGHCVSMSSTPNVAGVATSGGVPHSRVVFDGLPGPIDFALARIEPQYYSSVDPTMCHWGGPSGQNDSPQGGQTTHIYGWGLIYGSTTATRPRTGVVSEPGTNTLTYVGFAQPGDSGAPLMTGDGEAVGVHVRSSLTAVVVRVDPSPKYATRLTAAVAAAEAALGLDLELVSSTVPFSLTDGYTT